MSQNEKMSGIAAEQAAGCGELRDTLCPPARPGQDPGIWLSRDGECGGHHRARDHARGARPDVVTGFYLPCYIAPVWKASSVARLAW